LPWRKIMAEYTKEELLRKKEEARDTVRIRRQELAEKQSELEKAQKNVQDAETKLIDAQEELRKLDLKLDKRR